MENLNCIYGQKSVVHKMILHEKYLQKAYEIQDGASMTEQVAKKENLTK